MTQSERYVIRDSLYISLEAVARCYDVQASFIEEAYAHGLLGTGERVEDRVTVVAASQLDRVARIVRLHFHVGVNLEGIAVLLDMRG